MPYVGKKPADIIATAVDTTTGTFSGAVTVTGASILDGGVDVAGNLTLDADSGSIILKDGGTQFGLIAKTSNDLGIYASIADEDIVFKGTDGSTAITALTLDMSDAGTAIFNHNIKAQTDDGFLSSGASDDLIIFHDGTDSHVFNSTGDMIINSAASDKDLIFKGNDGGSTITALTLDMSDGGRAKFNSRANLNGAGDFGILTIAANTTAMTTRTNHHITLENTSQTTDAKGIINYKTNADSGASFTPVAFGGITVNPANATRTGAFCVYVSGTDNVDVGSDERMRIDSSGNLLVGSSNNSSDEVGARLKSGGRGDFTVSGGACSIMNRKASDGTILFLQQGNSTEGTISVDGSTVSYNGGHLSRWSQLTDNTRDNTLVKGTVMTNLDQMAEWTTDGVTEDNEQLNCMAISSVEGDANVAGVFVNWDNDDDVYKNDMNVAMTGDMVIRIAKDTTVSRGDLLMSAGDGTAKPQGDDIVRSKTIAKVTSTNKSHTYDDGTYLVPCVLMAC